MSAKLPSPAHHRQVHTSYSPIFKLAELISSRCIKEISFAKTALTISTVKRWRLGVHAIKHTSIPVSEVMIYTYSESFIFVYWIISEMWTELHNCTRLCYCYCYCSRYILHVDCSAFCLGWHAWQTSGYFTATSSYYSKFSGWIICKISHMHPKARLIRSPREKKPNAADSKIKVSLKELIQSIISYIDWGVAVQSMRWRLEIRLAVSALGKLIPGHLVWLVWLEWDGNYNSCLKKKINYITARCSANEGGWVGRRECKRFILL